MRKIYIILTHTGTLLSNIIKFYMGFEFSHVSIALDEQLEQMYSFGRLHPYNPFMGGFVHEHINEGTFKRFQNTRAKIYCLEIEDVKYENVKKYILQIQNANYKFNILGLFAAGFHIRRQKSNAFYCAEFVKYVIDKSNVNIALPEAVNPENFQYIEGTQEVYSGFLRNYCKGGQKC